MRSRPLIERLTANWPVKIISVTAAIVLYLFYRIGSLEERFLSVPLRIDVQNEFVPVGENPNSVRVTLRGSEDEIFLIIEDDIDAYVDLTDRDREGQFREPVMIRKTGTAENTDVEITVQPVEVTVTIERRIVKSLEVLPDIVGFPARGYELTRYGVSPSNLEVEGPRSAVESLNQIRTEEINLEGRTENFTIRVRVNLDVPSASLVGSDIVEFNGTIQEVVVSRSFDDVPVEAVGLEPGLAAELEQTRGLLRLRGPQLVMESLDVSQIGLFVDAAQADTPGEYRIPIRARHPEATEATDIVPDEVTINVVETEDQESEGSGSGEPDAPEESGGSGQSPSPDAPAGESPVTGG